MDERDPQGLQVFDQGHQVTQVATEPIEAPADQHIEPSPFGIGYQPIQLWPSILGSADTPIDVFDGGPVSRPLPPQLTELSLRS